MVDKKASMAKGKKVIVDKEYAASMDIAPCDISLLWRRKPKFAKNTDDESENKCTEMAILPQ